MCSSLIGSPESGPARLSDLSLDEMAKNESQRRKTLARRFINPTADIQRNILIFT